MDKNRVTVSISRDLYFEVERIVSESNGKLKTVDDYVEFVLRKVVKEEKGNEKQRYTKEEEKQIKKRLKSLGYL